jgi:hypothetical protein
MEGAQLMKDERSQPERLAELLVEFTKRRSARFRCSRLEKLLDDLRTAQGRAPIVRSDSNATAARNDDGTHQI